MFLRRPPLKAENLKAGDHHYRAFVGPPEKYDQVAAMQFNLLTLMGLREHHTVLDVGCGSLRVGRLLIPYLQNGHYFGIEPEKWLVQEGVRCEIGKDMVRLKEPTFLFSRDFPAQAFGVEFDFAIAQSVFSHATQEQIKLCLRNMAESLGERGVFLATFVKGTTDYTGSDWVYPGCVTYTPDTMRQFAQDVDLEFKTIDWPHPNGQAWGVFTSRDRMESVEDPTYVNNPLDTSKIEIQNIIEDAEGAGWFDETDIVGENISMHGWARNPITGQAARKIIIIDQDGKVVAATRVNQERTDVQQAFNDPWMLMSGWQVAVNTSTWPKKETTLKAYVFLDRDNTAIRINGQFTVPIN